MAKGKTKIVELETKKNEPVINFEGLKTKLKSAIAIGLDEDNQIYVKDIGDLCECQDISKGDYSFIVKTLHEDLENGRIRSIVVEEIIKIFSKAGFPQVQPMDNGGEEPPTIKQ